jgi:hypothetical protein
MSKIDCRFCYGALDEMMYTSPEVQDRIGDEGAVKKTMEALESTSVRMPSVTYWCHRCNMNSVRRCTTSPEDANYEADCAKQHLWLVETAKWVYKVDVLAPPPPPQVLFTRSRQGAYLKYRAQTHE